MEQPSAQYQITVEPVDFAVVTQCWAVRISGTGATIRFGAADHSYVTPGANLQQDILMQGSAVQKPHGTRHELCVSGAMPGSGTWAGTLTRMASHFFNFPHRRTDIVSNRACIGRIGKSSEGKALPVPGMWDIADPRLTPAPANSSSAFNTSYFLRPV